MSDDPIYYEIYGYRTEDDFQNCRGRELYLTEDTMHDAMVEARGLIEDTNTYAVVKVISSDSEEIKILRYGG